jgi:hypothetical protein
MIKILSIFKWTKLKYDNLRIKKTLKHKSFIYKKFNKIKSIDTYIFLKINPMIEM